MRIRRTAGIWRDVLICKPTDWLLKQIWQNEIWSCRCLLSIMITNQGSLSGLYHSFLMVKMTCGNEYWVAEPDLHFILSREKSTSVETVILILVGTGANICSSSISNRPKTMFLTWKILIFKIFLAVAVIPNYYLKNKVIRKNHLSHCSIPRRGINLYKQTKSDLFMKCYGEPRREPQQIFILCSLF